MSNPSPRKPSKVTIEISADGHTSDITVDVFEVSTEMSEGLRKVVERRRRERREARERAAGQTPPPADPPAQDGKPDERNDQATN
jgi:hypothetical protein